MLTESYSLLNYSSLAQRIVQNAISAIARTLKLNGLEDVSSDILTIHTEILGTWAAGDVTNPRNHITLLWDNKHKSLESDARRVLDTVQDALAQKRVMSNVRVFTSLLFISLTNIVRRSPSSSTALKHKLSRSELSALSSRGP